ncbi:MAG: HAMP domain-containing sensor histidine kinase [Bacteroidota bacterium]
MPIHLIRRIAILGALSIIGIIIIQVYTLRQSFTLADEEFDQSVRLALYQVAEKLAKVNQSKLPKQNLIQRRSSNYYAVNINDVIDANILEDYLIQELESRGINTDFEYAVYDCQSQDLVYGNYCKPSDLKETKESRGVLPTFDDLVYYFVVRFPSRRGYVVGSMGQIVLFSLITALALIFFLYSIWIILQQKRLSDLQKDFINNMTHEFKTPISSIKIAANVIKSHPLIDTSDRLKKYSEIIVEQNERLNNQVEKVLNLARLEQDSFKLTLEQFDITSTIEKVVNAEHLKVQEQGQGEVMYEGLRSSYTIIGDKLHFSNVLHSIIDNAVKYCTSIPRVIIRAYVKGQEVFIDVVDNGIGIPKENMENLFKKFYRVPTGDVHDVKGFGLGLFYVQNICEAHGWDIKVLSEPGVGSTFRIIIPHNG